MSGGADPSAARGAAAKGSRRPAEEGLAARIPGVVVALAGAGLLAWSLWSGSRPVEGLQRGGDEWLVPESRVQRRAAVGPQERAEDEQEVAGASEARAGGRPAPGSGGEAGKAGGDAPGVVTERRGGAGDGGDLLIDINMATAAQFELLPEIGPVMAQRLADDRAANGPFASVDDLMRVRGIGPKTVEKLRDLVVCGGGGGS